jgi:hypothetical protein
VCAASWDGTPGHIGHKIVAVCKAVPGGAFWDELYMRVDAAAPEGVRNRYRELFEHVMRLGDKDLVETIHRSADFVFTAPYSDDSDDEEEEEDDDEEEEEEEGAEEASRLEREEMAAVHATLQEVLQRPAPAARKAGWLGYVMQTLVDEGRPGDGSYAEGEEDSDSDGDAFNIEGLYDDDDDSVGGGGRGRGSAAADDDSWSDDDEEHDSDHEPSAADGAVDAVVAGLKSHGRGIILLSAPPSTATTRSAVLQTTKHLLLHAAVAEEANAREDRMSKVACRWPGGGTSLGNALWHRHLLPDSSAALRAVRAGKLQAAFGKLLGTFLFVAGDDCWLRDNEVYGDDWGKFEGFFQDTSDAWKALLAHSDEELGFAPPPALAADAKSGAATREELVVLLRSWQERTNRVLEDRYDEHADGDPVRVDIV